MLARNLTSILTAYVLVCFSVNKPLFFKCLRTIRVHPSGLQPLKAAD